MQCPGGAGGALGRRAMDIHDPAGRDLDGRGTVADSIAGSGRRRPLGRPGLGRGVQRIAAAAGKDHRDQPLALMGWGYTDMRGRRAHTVRRAPLGCFEFI